MVVRISDKTQNYSKVTKLLVKPSDNYTAIQNLEELGYINGEDFFVAARFLSFLDGGFA